MLFKKNKKEVPILFNSSSDRKILELIVSILVFVLLGLIVGNKEALENYFSQTGFWILVGTSYLFLVQLNRIKYVLRLLPSTRIEKGWQLPFQRHLYKAQVIEKQNFYGLELVQKEDLTWDIVAKSSIGTNITISNIVNKNPALEKLAELKINEFKSWV